MARPDFPRTIVDFQERFSDEAACLEYLAASRWPEGYHCPACAGEHAWVLDRRHLRECARCHHHLGHGGDRDARNPHPVAVVVWSAYLIATHAPGISAQAAAAPAWHWALRDRLADPAEAAAGDDQPRARAAAGEVEIDETYVGGRHSSRRGGREREGKTLVGVAVEVRGQRSGRLRMNVLGGLDGDTLAGWVSEIVEPGAIVHTDGSSGYGKLTRSGFDHRPRLQHLRGPDRQFVLPRADRAISNLKTWLQGTHRSASAKHPQVYLDEFVFRHNRRRTPMVAFQTLLGLGALHEPTPTARSPVAPQPEPTGYSRAALCMEGVAQTPLARGTPTPADAASAER